MLSAGPYRWRAHDLTALGVATNRVTFGAYRAPGAPPAAFAVESLIDELAGRARSSTRSSCGCATSSARATRPRRARRSRSSARASASSALRDHPLWARRDELPDGEGIGVALGLWPGGL